GPAELLALPLVHVGPDHVAVGAVEFRVEARQRLNVIVAGGDLLQTAQGISERARIDHGALPWSQLADVHPVERRGVSPSAGLQSRLGIVPSGDDDKDSARHWL